MTISAWWLIALVPAFLVGNFMGYNSGMRTMRKASRIAKKLLEFGNTTRAIKILDIAEGVRTKEENRTFDSRLQGLDDKS